MIAVQLPAPDVQTSSCPGLVDKTPDGPQA